MLAMMAGILVPGRHHPPGPILRYVPGPWAALPCAAYHFDLSHFYGVSQMLPCIALMAEVNVLAA